MSAIGGGFLINQGGNNNNNNNNFNNPSIQNSANKNASPFKGDRNLKKGSIIPLTIKKLLEASSRLDDIVEVDGTPIDQAVIIGRVYKMEEQSTRRVLHMDDSTGRIQVAYYKRSDNQGQSAVDNIYYTDNMYMKAVVVVRPFKTQKLYVSNMLQPVTDYNQISYHFLSVFLASAYRTKGPLPKSDPNLPSPTAATNQAINNNNFGNYGGQMGNINDGGGTGPGNSMRNMANPSNRSSMGNMDDPSNMGAYQSAAPSNDPKTLIKDTIAQIQSRAPNAMCKQSQLIQALKGKMNPNTIQGYLMQLESSAEIYRDESQAQGDPTFYLF